MPVTVVVGGQYGGEGKGKVVHCLSKEMNVKAVVRVGGTNSGHTVIDDNDNPLILRQLPTSCILPNVTSILCAGSYIDVDLLFREIDETRIDKNCLLIDPNAMIIKDYNMEDEKNSGLRGLIGSTLSGTGSAVMSRIKRDKDISLAKDEIRIKEFIHPAAPYMRKLMNEGERIIIEGTQGFGLSLLHSPYYPYTTSRDTTAASFISEAGLSPMDVDDIVLVIRTFPIRVSGNSGPLINEISWDVVADESEGFENLKEYTSVTKTLRRVGRFDQEIVKMAIMHNQPTRIVMNHLDYIDSRSVVDGVTEKIYQFCRQIEDKIGRQIDMVGVGQKELIKL